MTRLPPFELHRPTTIEEATGLFVELGDEAIAYAGGTELLLLFKFGFADYPHLIDVKAIEELGGISRINGWLRIGAAETHRRIERNADVRSGWPALAEMERGVGNIRVRTMGSIGGNLCFADPHSDPATFLLAADAVVKARRGDSAARTVAIGDLVTGPFETSLEHGELLTEVRIPTLREDAVIVHRKFALHERPAVTLSVHLRSQEGRFEDVRLAVGSAGVIAARATEAEAILNRRAVSELDAVIAEVRSNAADAADPVEDANGSVEYKRHLVGVIAERALRDAIGDLHPQLPDPRS